MPVASPRLLPLLSQSTFVQFPSSFAGPRDFAGPNNARGSKNLKRHLAFLGMELQDQRRTDGKMSEAFFFEEEILIDGNCHEL